MNNLKDILRSGRIVMFGYSETLLKKLSKYF